MPIEGCFPLAPSFDHVGPMARDVAGCERMMAALVPGFEPAGLDSLGDLRVGVAWTERAHPLVRERVEAVAARVAGARRVGLPLPDDVGPAFAYEAGQVHEELFREHRELYGENMATKVERALRLDADRVSASVASRERYREQMAELLEDLDLVLTPTLTMVAPRLGIGDLALRERVIELTFPFNAIGAPALAMPCGPAEDGLPASVQLAGKPGDDALVLAAGRRLEAMIGANWAGKHAYRARRLHRPATSRRCARSSRARRGCGCSARATRSPTSPTPTSWSRSTALPADVAVDRDDGTVSFARGRALRRPRRRAGRRGPGAAQPRLAPAHLGGGRGRDRDARLGRLATATSPRRSPALELVTSDGELVPAARGDADFDGLVVGLGALGAVTRITLDVEPAYEVRQRVFEGLAWDALFEHFDAITARGYSVSVFTRWRETADQVWVKSRDGDPAATSSSARGRRPSSATRSSGSTRSTARAQLGVPGPVVGPPAALPHGLHAEQRRGDPVRVPRRRARTPSAAIEAMRGARRRDPRRSCRCARSARSPPTGCG